jgi:hypothetical protein
MGHPRLLVIAEGHGRVRTLATSIMDKCGPELIDHCNVTRTTIKPRSLVEHVETTYIAGFAFLQLFTSLVHPYLLPAGLRDRWAFVPLLVTSVYCSIGIWWSWARLAFATWRSGSDLSYARKAQ